MNREGLDAADLETALREHGVASIHEVELAVLEPDGSISVVPRKGHVTDRPRRMRIVSRR